MTKPPTDLRWKYEPSLRRTIVDRVWAPWNAVRSGTYLDEFLQARFWHYLARMPQRPSDPAYEVEVRGTEIVRRDVTPATQPIRAFDDRELETARERELEASLRVEAATSDLDFAEAALARSIADGTVFPSARAAVRAARPAMPSRTAIVVVVTLLIALASSEALMLAFPFWDAVGVDTSNLWTELRAQLVGVLGGAGFAIAAVLALIGTAERLRDFWRVVWGRDTTRRDRWSNGSLLIGGAALLGGAVYGLAAMRHGMSAATGALVSGLAGGASSGGFGAWVFVVVTLLILFASPAATSWLHARLDLRRRASDAIRAYELDTESKHVARERLVETIATARAELAESERALAAAGAALRSLETRASDAARRQNDLATDEHRHAVAYSRALCAALEADRFAFIRRARRRGRPELLGASPMAVHSIAPAVRLVSRATS